MSKTKLEDEPAALPEVGLMEDLVRASLAVNPAMRGGLETADVMERLRQQTARPSPSLPVRRAPVEEHPPDRADAEAFLRNKRRQLRGKLSALEEQRRALDARVLDLKRRTLVELSELLAESELDVDECGELLAAHHDLLADLSVHVHEVLDEMEERRGA